MTPITTSTQGERKVLARHIPNLESLKIPEAEKTAIRRLYQMLYDLRDHVLSHLIVGLGYRPNAQIEVNPDGSGATLYLPCGTLVKEFPTGVMDGSNTDFTISHEPIANSFWLAVNGVVQEENIDFVWLSPTSMRYSYAPVATDWHVARYQWANYGSNSFTIPVGDSGGGTSGGSGGGPVGAGGYDGTTWVGLYLIARHYAFVMSPYGPLDYVPGDRARLEYDATHYMEGTVTDYFAWWAPGNMSQMGIDIDTVVGTGLYTQWVISKV